MLNTKIKIKKICFVAFDVIAKILFGSKKLNILKLYILNNNMLNFFLKLSRSRILSREINKGNSSILDQNTFNIVKGFVEVLR